MSIEVAGLLRVVQLLKKNTGGPTWPYWMLNLALGQGNPEFLGWVSLEESQSKTAPGGRRRLRVGSSCHHEKRGREGKPMTCGFLWQFLAFLNVITKNRV